MLPGCRLRRTPIDLRRDPMDLVLEADVRSTQARSSEHDQSEYRRSQPRRHLAVNCGRSVTGRQANDESGKGDTDGGDLAHSTCEALTAFRERILLPVCTRAWGR